MLSVTTLKRFFGVIKHEGLPSITTLDALSRFIGKENWRAFKLSSKRSPNLSGVSRKSLYITTGFVLAVFTLFLIGNKRPDIVINTSDFTFSSQVLSNQYPNSVLFDFEIPPKLKTDSLHIQQYWDPTKTILIDQNQKQATGIYYFPGYFRAKLMVENQPVLSHDLFLKSNGWIGTIEYEPIPKYFEPLIGDSSLSFPDEIFREVSESNTPVTSTFHFIDDLGPVSGDHFTLHATIQNVFDDRWAVCQAFKVYCIGTAGAMVIPFSKIGCVSDNNLMLNDQYLSGKENDLSSLSADFSVPVDIKVTVLEKQVAIRINEKPVYTLSYHETMGRLVGLRFKFKGLGVVKSFEVLDNTNKRIVF